MGHRRTISIIILWLVASLTHAQQPLDSRSVEENSFRMLQDKKWSDLINLGNSALDHDIDYFYLRLRMGIAYYEQGKYRQAVVQFKRALDFNSTDAVTQEYYYYSLLFSWSFDEARKYGSALSDSVKIKIHWSEIKGVNVVYGEMGPKISGRRDLYSNAFYFQAGLNHTVGNKLSLSHAFTYYRQNLTVGPFNQYQYYLSASLPLSRGWTAATTFHVVGQNLDSAIYVGPGSGRPPMTIYQSVNSTGVVGALAISKKFPFLDVMYSSAISNVDGYTQYIQQFNMTIFPLGNNNLSIGNMTYYHTEKTNGSWAMSPFVTFKPASRWLLQGIYFTNQNKNIVERNGYFVNNALDLTTSRWTGIADYSLNRHLSVYGVYMFENKRTSAGEAYDYATYIIGLKIIP